MVELWPSNCEVLNSNPSSAKKKKKKGITYSPVSFQNTDTTILNNKVEAILGKIYIYKGNMDL
jgi:hypothetical protein